MRNFWVRETFYGFNIFTGFKLCTLYRVENGFVVFMTQVLWFNSDWTIDDKLSLEFVW